MGQTNEETFEADCPLCSSDDLAEFIETITSASVAIGVEMSPKAFRKWLMDEARHPES